MNIASGRDSALTSDTLQQRVAARLREPLVQGRCRLASNSNERVLCERLGVSRTPLREAMRVLAAEGLPSLAPGRGAYAPACRPRMWPTPWM